MIIFVSQCSIIIMFGCKFTCLIRTTNYLTSDSFENRTLLSWPIFMFHGKILAFVFMAVVRRGLQAGLWHSSPSSLLRCREVVVMLAFVPVFKQICTDLFTRTWWSTFHYASHHVAICDTRCPLTSTSFHVAKSSIILYILHSVVNYWLSEKPFEPSWEVLFAHFTIILREKHSLFNQCWHTHNGWCNLIKYDTIMTVYMNRI